jgi:TadE-like protein
LKRAGADKSRMRSTSRSGAAPAKAAADVPARPRESGQALVEFALIAPLFLLLVVGIIQFGIGLNYWLDLNRIANQGARWAVTDRYPGCDGTPGSTGCRTAPDETLKTQLESEPVSGGLTPEASICFERATGVLPTDPLPDDASTQVGQPIRAQVTTKFTFLPILDLGEFDLVGTATMRIEQPPLVLRSQSVGWCP